jgi:hypothetical protein
MFLRNRDDHVMRRFDTIQAFLESGDEFFNGSLIQATIGNETFAPFDVT